jgi:hypothetical protein
VSRKPLPIPSNDLLLIPHLSSKVRDFVVVQKFIHFPLPFLGHVCFKGILNKGIGKT